MRGLWRLGLRLSIAALFFASDLACSWSAQGHASISLRAYKNLSPGAKKRYEYAADTIKDLVEEQAVTTYKNCKKYQSICDFAVWPDRVKKARLGRYFESLDVAIPVVLKEFAEQDSGSWHYHNAFYSTSERRFVSQCDGTDRGRLPEAVAAFERVLNTKANEQQKAVALSFWVHLISDAYQPLHTISKQVSGCRHDLGGNLTCAQRDGHKCTRSLHQLWDSGANIFDSAGWYRPVEKQLATGFWLIQKEVKSFAPRIYPSSEDYHSKGYRTFVQQTAASQASLAVQHISGFLEVLWRSHNE